MVTYTGVKFEEQSLLSLCRADQNKSISDTYYNNEYHANIKRIRCMKIIKELKIETSGDVMSFLHRVENDQEGVDFIGTGLFDFSHIPPVIETILDVTWNVKDNDDPKIYDKFADHAVTGTHYFKIDTITKTHAVYLIKTLDSKLVIIKSKNLGDDTWGNPYLGFSGLYTEFFSLMMSMRITREDTIKYYLGTGLPNGFSLVAG